MAHERTRRDPMAQGLRRLATLVLVCTALGLAGCAGIERDMGSAPAATTQSQTGETPFAATPAGDAGQEDTTMQVTELAVDGREQTLLNAIADAQAELAPLTAHRYVEIETENGALWQGEMLQTASQRVYFLQARGGDWQRAWRVETGTGAEPAQIGAGLPDVATDLHPAPDVDVQTVQPQPGDGSGDTTRWRFSVTIAHPDTGWDDYVDGWLVIGPADEVLGTRILLHPHETEQPFTRSLGDVSIPQGVAHVTIRPHDLVSGYDEGMRIPLAVPEPTPTP